MKWLKKFFAWFKRPLRCDCVDLCQLDQDFAYWAFGDIYKKYLIYEGDAIDLVNAWNERHLDKLKVEPSDIISRSLGLMAILWAKEGYPRQNKEEIKND